MTKDIEQRQEPQIGNIVKIICFSAGGVEKEVIGRLEGYQSNEFGQYIKLKEHQAIYAPSIIKWEILHENN